MPWLLPRWVALALLGAALLLAPMVRGSESASPARLLGSVFFVAKSENKNQVHYGIRLDESCVPAGDAPVFAYWRMLERGPLATEPLLSREVPAYGVAVQRTERHATGGRVTLTLNALPGRTIAVDSAAAPTGCTASARAAIGGVVASLSSVYVKLRWPFGVDYLLLSGRAEADGHWVRERVGP